MFGNETREQTMPGFAQNRTSERKRSLRHRKHICHASSRIALHSGRARAKIFYPSNIGRDDGLTVWGNMAKGLVQYRVGVFDGPQGSQNMQKHPRTTASMNRKG
jgi:hypothetical protein